MKLLVEIPDNKVESLILLLKEIPKVKVKVLIDSKATLIKEIREAVEEMKEIKKGKKSGRNAEDFLNEL